MKQGMKMAAAFLVCSVLRLPVQAQDGSRPEPAAGQSITGTIVRIDGEDILIDIGGAGARKDLELTVYRSIEVRHPVTRKKLRDRFAIGVLGITQPGSSLSMARVKAKPSRPIAVGDALESGPVAPASGSTRPAGSAAAAAVAACPPVAPARACPKCEAGADEQEHKVIDAWKATLARPPADRIRIYQTYLLRNPFSPYRDFVRAEIAHLASREQELVQARTAAGEQSLPLSGELAIDRISQAREGDTVELAASYDPEGPVRGLILHTRATGGEPDYSSTNMKTDGRGHARARVPEKMVRTPGFEYFVEAVDEEGRASAADGSAVTPIPVEVKQDLEGLEDMGHRVRVRFQSEYISFDKFSGNDWSLLNEGDFLYRLRLDPLYGVRIGYGHYHGSGGTVEELDELGLEPDPASFTYGYLEGEVKLHRLFALAGRATVGLGRPETEEDQREGLTGGFQLRIRIGPEDGTSLLLAGEAMPEIGQRAYVGLAWEAIAGWPMAAEVHVTDQPVDSDELAVRLVYELGWRMTEQFALAARASVQGRTFEHTGPGFGLAATFDW
jgi:hypothetical protein